MGPENLFANQGKVVFDRIVLPLERKSVLPPQPELSSAEDEVFTRAEQMPRFSGCEDKVKEEKKIACATNKMLVYIYERVKYPHVAAKNNIQGIVEIQFVVEKDGTLSNIKITNDIGSGCGEASAVVIRRMNDRGKKWISGKQDGQAVRVLFILPVKFILN